MRRGAADRGAAEEEIEPRPRRLAQAFVFPPAPSSTPEYPGPSPPPAAAARSPPWSKVSRSHNDVPARPLEISDILILAFLRWLALEVAIDKIITPAIGEVHEMDLSLVGIFPGEHDKDRH